jgi:hypothetical protein
MAGEGIQLLTQRLTPGLGGHLMLIVPGLFIQIIAGRNGRPEPAGRPGPARHDGSHE